MTAFLTLNGWDFGVTECSASAEEVGDVSRRGFAGQHRSSRQAVKRVWDCTSDLLPKASAEALRHLVLGEGWHLPFDADIYSENTGLVPTSGYTCTLSTSSPKYGAKCLSVPSGTFVFWDAGLVATTGYTLAVWYYSGSAWVHYALTVLDSTAAYYIDGVLQGATTWAHVGLSGTSAFLHGAAPAGTHGDKLFDDLVVLPWCAPAELVAAMAASSTAFSGLPRLDLGGTCVEGATAVEVRGTLGKAQMVQAFQSGTWDPNGRRVPFTLVEV